MNMFIVNIFKYRFKTIIALYRFKFHVQFEINFSLTIKSILLLKHSNFFSYKDISNLNFSCKYDVIISPENII